MTKRTRNGRKQSCKTSCLTCTFFTICKLLLDKKRKKKKKENCCHSRKFFPLQMKCFLIFAKVFYAQFVPKITIRESFCQKFRDFFISRKFLLAKVSAPKVYTPKNSKNLYFEKIKIFKALAFSLYIFKKFKIFVCLLSTFCYILKFKKYFVCTYFQVFLILLKFKEI